MEGSPAGGRNGNIHEWTEAKAFFGQTRHTPHTRRRACRPRSASLPHSVDLVSAPLSFAFAAAPLLAPRLRLKKKQKNTHTMRPVVFLALVLLVAFAPRPATAVNCAKLAQAHSIAAADLCIWHTKPCVKTCCKPITTAPTDQPTSEPTAQPTAQPTAEPTAQPTNRPTKKIVTLKPTRMPTSKPTTKTNSPTRKPIVQTRSPTSKPVVKATRKPAPKTLRPTNMPTNAVPAPPPAPHFHHTAKE